MNLANKMFQVACERVYITNKHHFSSGGIGSIIVVMLNVWVALLDATAPHTSEPAPARDSRDQLVF